MLNYPSGTPFSTGMISCEIAPLNSTIEDNVRIILGVAIDGVPAQAVVDTGGVYCILHPAVALNIGFDPSSAIGNKEITIHGLPYKGSLFRSLLEIFAEQGESLEQQVTVFVPDATPEEWGWLPTYLGLTGCLEYLRFAVDPIQNQFYFAPASS